MNSRFSTIQESFRAAGMPPPQLHGTVSVTKTENHADQLAELKTALNFCADGAPDELVEIRQQSGSRFGFPALAISWLGLSELIARSDQEKGRHPHRHEPVDSIQALERSLKKGIAAELKAGPDVFMSNLALTGSPRFFELPLEYGLKPDPEKTRQMLRTTRLTAMEEYKKNIQHYRDIKTQHRKSERNRQEYAEPWARLGGVTQMFNLPNLAEELAKSWRPAGIRLFAENRLSGMHRMDLLTRSYGRVHTFIARLSAAARANALIAAEAEEKQTKQTPSRTARKKARQKAAKAERQAAEQAKVTEQISRLAIRPVSPFASSSGSVGVNRAEPLPTLSHKDESREMPQTEIFKESLNPRKSPDNAAITPGRVMPETAQSIDPERPISQEVPTNRASSTLKVYFRKKTRQPSAPQAAESSDKAPSAKNTFHKAPVDTAVSISNAGASSPFQSPSIGAEVPSHQKRRQAPSESKVEPVLASTFVVQRGNTRVLTWQPGSRFHQWLDELARQATPADRERIASREGFTPETRRSIREAEQEMKKRWAQAMQQNATKPDSDVVIYSSEIP